MHSSYETAVAVQSGIAYVVGLDRLHVMDVSDPAAIVEVGELARAEDAPIQYTRTVSDFTVSGYERAEVRSTGRGGARRLCLPGVGLQRPARHRRVDTFRAG